MKNYLARRLLETMTVVFIMSLVIYLLIGLMPGDPIDVMINSNPDLTPADAARLRALYGLDQPLIERYGHWLTAALQGDMGYSRLHALPVLEVLPPYLWNTVVLMTASFAVSILVALPVGIYTALRPNSLFDYGVNLFCFAGISVPVFWLALMLIIVFSVMLGWLPAGGAGAIEGGGTLRHMILPVITLSVASIGHYTRYMRAAMMETLRQDYIRTARAKGAGWRRIVLRHALRNALIPVVTVLALSFGTLFSGALITETMFAYPGVGKLTFDAIMGNDFNLALVCLLFATFLTLSANLGADLIYGWLDPRISYDPGRRR